MVVIVKTPLQLICAMEYLCKNQISLQDVEFIYLEKYQLSSEQMINTFHYYGIINYRQIAIKNSNIATIFGKRVILGNYVILKIPFKLFSIFVNYFIEKRILKLLNKHSTIIFGDPNYKLYRKLCNQLINKEIILLDDGLGSSQIRQKYVAQNKITSFSFLRDKKTESTDILINDFSLLKSKINKIDANIIYFIGQPLIESRLVSIETLNYWFKKIGNQFSDKTIIYYPHRWELDYDSYQFPNNFKLSDSINLPIELSVSTSNYQPSVITSFYSSALVTLRNILPSEIKIYAIDISASINNPKIDHVYKIISSYDIEVLHL